MVAEPTWRQLQIGVESDREVTLRPRWETSPSGLECQQGREPREGEGFGQHSLGVFRVSPGAADFANPFGSEEVFSPRVALRVRR